jgi:iron complex transport system substrate-binding protein
VLLAAAALFWPVPAATQTTLPQDGAGHLLIDQPVERIITLSPHLAELVYAAGAGDKLVATTDYSEFPEAAAAVPRIGDAFRLDIERIVSLDPDLIIAWGSGNPAAAIAQLRGLDLPVWAVEIRQLEGIATTIELIGRATGNPAAAVTAARQFRTRVSALAARYADSPPLDYFYQVGEQPLFTINGEHLISQGLRLCGGHNIFADETGLAFQVAHESVIVADPQALFAPWLQEQSDPLAGWRSWPGMQAVANDALFLLHADKISRASPRMLDALETACRQLQALR